MNREILTGLHRRLPRKVRFRRLVANMGRDRGVARLHDFRIVRRLATVPRDLEWLTLGS